MMIYLAKTLDNMKLYGPIYDLTLEPADRVETYQFGATENDWILDNLVDKINAECDALLDDGDYDFFEPSKCIKLRECLSAIDKSSLSVDCNRLVEVMEEFANRAVEYNTGIAIDL